MELEKLLLKKEELPILHETCFFVPIHPKLLSPDIKLDEDIAYKVFPQAAEEGYNNLSEYAKTLNDEETKKWIKNVFLKRKPKIKKEYNHQILDPIGWHDNVRIDENGFASLFSINRNVRGSLYFNKDYEFEEFISFREHELIRFSKDKKKEFGFREEDLGDNIKGVIMNVYRQHNVDAYPGALFLRNWAMVYMNEAIKQAFPIRRI